MLKVSAFYLEKQKSFIPKKYFLAVVNIKTKKLCLLTQFSQRFWVYLPKSMFLVQIYSLPLYLGPTIRAVLRHCGLAEHFGLSEDSENSNKTEMKGINNEVFEDEKTNKTEM